MSTETILAPTTTETGETSAATTTEPAQTENPQTTQATTPPDATQSGEAKAQESAPAAIEVKLAEGVEIDAEVLEALKGAAKDSEGAQKAADAFIAAQQRAAEKLDAEIAKQHEAWANAVKADKELGGENMPRTLENAKRGFAKVGTPELAQLLTNPTYGNHPELVRLLARVGALTRDDSIAGTTAATSAPDSEEARLRRAYSNSPELFKNAR